MADVKYYLDKPKAPKSIILLSYHFDGKRLWYSTRISIAPKLWNGKSQKVKEVKEFRSEAKEINNYLSKLEGQVKTIHLNFKNQGRKPSKSEFKKELDYFTQRSKKDSPKTLFGFIEKYIEDKTNVLQNGTIKTYITTKNILHDFSATLDFEDIDLKFYEKFVDYCTKKRELSINYTGKHIKNLKTFLKKATKEKINRKLDFQDPDFKVLEEDVFNVYLTPSELTTLYYFKSEKERNNLVKDCFIIACFTGLRFSDFSRLEKGNLRTIVDENGQPVEVIDIITQKTGEQVVIPLNPFVRGILDKYNGNPPKSYTSQKMNLHIKEVCKEAGLTEKITYEARKGVFKTIEKWEKITNHTARRSFATNAYKAKISPISIMQITGHKTETSFLKYIKVTKEENAILLSQNPFFQTAPMAAIK